MCPILVILRFQTLALWSYLSWWPVISDLWCYYYNCFGAPHTTPRERGKRDYERYVSWLHHSWSFSPHLPLLRPPYSLGTAILKSGQVIILQWPHRSSERKSCISLPLNQKLEMIKLSEQGMSKAEIGWKLRPLASVSQVMDVKESAWRKWKVLLHWIYKWRWNSFTADMEKVVVVWTEDQTSHNIHSLSQSLMQSRAPTLFNSLKAERWGSCRRKVWG